MASYSTKRTVAEEAGQAAWGGVINFSERVDVKDVLNLGSNLSTADRNDNIPRRISPFSITAPRPLSLSRAAH